MPQLMVVRLPGLPPLIFPLFALWILLAVPAAAALAGALLARPFAGRESRLERRLALFTSAMGKGWTLACSLSGLSVELEMRGKRRMDVTFL